MTRGDDMAHPTAAGSTGSASIGSGIRRAAVLGAGSWGTTVAKVLADAGADVSVWARRRDVVDAINTDHENPAYLPGVALPRAVSATQDALEALRQADLVGLAVPSQTLRANLALWAPHLPAHAPIVSLIKGIEMGTLLRMSEVVTEVAGVDQGRILVVTGPNLAWELAHEQPAATVVAGTDPVRAAQVQQALTTGYLRPYTNLDLIGCELAGAVKNVIALAFGMGTGMGLGDNTRATLITRGLAEITRLGSRLGADPLTFSGLAGLGDLVATCCSPLARNRTVGEHLGRGATLAEAQAAAKQTAEGVLSCLSIRDLARVHGVEMPITEQVERVCHEGLSPQLAVTALMGRETKPE